MAQIKNPAGLMIEIDDMEADRRLARSVRALMKDEWPLGAGECRSFDRKAIDADAELAAYFAVVATAGAWSEERLRVGLARLGPVPRRSRDESGPGPLTIPNICRILPIWRQWGRLLIEAGRAKAAGGAAGRLEDVGGDDGPAPVLDPEPDDHVAAGPKRR